MFGFKKKQQVNAFEELERNLKELDRLSEELDDLNNVLLAKIEAMNEEVEKITARLAV